MWKKIWSSLLVLPWSLAQDRRAGEQLCSFAAENPFSGVTKADSKNIGRSHVKHIPVILEMLENVLQTSGWVCTDWVELDYAGLFGCFSSMVPNSLSFRRIYQLSCSTSHEVTVWIRTQTSPAAPSKLWMTPVSSRGASLDGPWAVLRSSCKLHRSQVTLCSSSCATL